MQQETVAQEFGVTPDPFSPLVIGVMNATKIRDSSITALTLAFSPLVIGVMNATLS